MNVNNETWLAAQDVKQRFLRPDTVRRVIFEAGSSLLEQDIADPRRAFAADYVQKLFDTLDVVSLVEPEEPVSVGGITYISALRQRSDTGDIIEVPEEQLPDARTADEGRRWVDVQIHDAYQRLANDNWQ